jgi:hypothetical protein
MAVSGKLFKVRSMLQGFRSVLQPNTGQLLRIQRRVEHQVFAGETVYKTGEKTRYFDGFRSREVILFNNEYLSFKKV